MVLQVLPRSREKSWHWEKKLNCLICMIDWGLQLWLPTVWRQMNTFKNRLGNMWDCRCCYARERENLALFTRYCFISYWKLSFYVGTGLLIRKVYLQTLNMIREKSEVIIWQSKRKVQDLKLENFMPAKDCWLILERDWLKKCQDNRGSSFWQPRGSRQVPRHH